MYLSSEPVELKTINTSEQIFVKLQIEGSPDLYIGVFYKPHKKPSILRDINTKD